MGWGVWVPGPIPQFREHSRVIETTPEFYDFIVKPPVFLGVHYAFQVFHFIVFLGWVKLFFAVIAFLIWMIFLASLSLFKPLFKSKIKFQRFAHSVCKHLVRLFLMCLGIVKISVGEPVSETARILVSNSVSILDYFIYFCSTPFTVLQSSDVSGPERLLLGSIFDSFPLRAPGGKKEKMKAQYRIEHAASDPSLFPLLVFPEQQKTNGDAVLEFDKDPFANDYEIQGAAIRYWLALTPRGFNSLSGEAIFPLLFRILAIPFLTVHVDYLKIDERKEPDRDFNKKAETYQIDIANKLKVLPVKLDPVSPHRKSS
jgi:hypothetical protein